MNVLLDTGPLVAIISKEDADHQASVEAFAELRDAPITCWPVLTEAAWLLRHRLEHVETLFDFAAEGIITIVDLNVADFSIWLHRFFQQYSDQKPQLADAALMFLSEQLQIGSAFTLDRRDFTIFRTSAGKSLTILPSA